MKDGDDAAVYGLWDAHDGVRGGLWKNVLSSWIPSSISWSHASSILSDPKTWENGHLSVPCPNGDDGEHDASAGPLGHTRNARLTR